MNVTSNVLCGQMVPVTDRKRIYCMLTGREQVFLTLIWKCFKFLVREENSLLVPIPMQVYGIIS